MKSMKSDSTVNTCIRCCSYIHNALFIFIFFCYNEAIKSRENQDG
jgi:hypothetical protein